WGARRVVVVRRAVWLVVGRMAAVDAPRRGPSERPRGRQRTALAELAAVQDGGAVRGAAEQVHRAPTDHLTGVVAPGLPEGSHVRPRVRDGVVEVDVGNRVRPLAASHEGDAPRQRTAGEGEGLRLVTALREVGNARVVPRRAAGLP